MPNFRVAHDPLQTLLNLYALRPDLQKAFVEVTSGENTRLIKWAASVSSGQTEDSSRAVLLPHAEWYASRSEGLNSLALNRSSDGCETYPGHPVWKGVIPLPPLGLLWAVGSESLESFLSASDAWHQVISPYLSQGSTILDIGCGCGRLARLLVRHTCVSRYVGFDVIPENIEWSKRFIEPLAEGKADFLRYDLYSAEYNPNGKIRGSDLRFPCEDGSVDLAIAASIFTHLLEPDAIHYLHEIGRVLRSNGRALMSIHGDVPKGERFTGNESRIDIEPSYFRELASAAGLTEADRIDDLCGQQVFVFYSRGVVAEEVSLSYRTA